MRFTGSVPVQACIMLTTNFKARHDHHNNQNTAYLTGTMKNNSGVFHTQHPVKKGGPVQRCRLLSVALANGGRDEKASPGKSARTSYKKYLSRYNLNYAWSL